LVYVFSGAVYFFAAEKNYLKHSGIFCDRKFLIDTEKSLLRRIFIRCRKSFLLSEIFF